VSVVTLASIKGSPGVTTAALALAAGWPSGRRVLLVEADPFGGDLAPRHGSTITHGLPSLFAAARRSLAPEAVWDHVDHLPGGLPALFGLSGVQGATANEKAWPVVAAALGGLDADVVVDAGRLLPNFAGGTREILEHSDALVVVCDPTLEGIVHLRAALPALLAEIRNRQLLIVPTASGTYGGSEISATLGVSVGSPLPHDRKAADAFANRRSVTRLERTALFKWANALARDLGIEALTGEPLDSEPLDSEPLETGASNSKEASLEGDDPNDSVDQTELGSSADDEERVSAAVSGQASPNRLEIPAPMLDASALLDDSASRDHADEALAVGAGSSGKAQP
jgi:MinD-like ATPase involved in chromosome partitioning or flagellar assembly